MPSHRAQPPRRRAAPPRGRRRAEPVHPRYGRLAVLAASVGVTGIAMLGGVGVLPSVASGSGGSSGDQRGAGEGSDQVLAGASTSVSVDPSDLSDPSHTSSGTADQVETEVTTEPVDPPVPADSGEGRRIVFDQSDQRVWLVSDDGSVARTYLVSGSRYDNLDPGTYSVYSRSANATGIEQSGTMRYFVRFTEGTGGGAIGFHDIPLSGGEPVQSTDQLGTPQSHGCVRQARKDAIALWGFAPVGTEVDVVA
jgi:lipoprotein-anchoring transpeptidase ErfK/SrfK